MITKFKVLLAKKSILHLINKSHNCSCIKCIKYSIEKNELPCICPKLELPCVALHSKYTSAKALKKLIAENNAVKKGVYVVIPYKQEFTDSKFISAVNSLIEKQEVK